MDIRPLSSKLQKIAEEELNEVPNRVLDDLKDIEEWLLKQPHLNIRKDHQWLLVFLRNSKFSLQRTKEKLDYFYSIKCLMPEFFANKDPMLPEIQEILKARAAVPLTKTTDEAGFPTILLLKWKNANPNKITFANFLKMGLMNMDVLLNKNDNFTVNGVYILHDMEKFPLGFVKHLTPALCMKAVLSMTKAYPVRIKGIYFMNMSPFYETIINMFMPFLSTKMKNRMKVFGENSFDELLKYIPVKLFPKDYGGEGQSYDELADEWRTTVENHRDWFLEDVQYCSNEERRPGKPLTSADVFGVEGSFRKLNVD